LQPEALHVEPEWRIGGQRIRYRHRALGIEGTHADCPELAGMRGLDGSIAKQLAEDRETLALEKDLASPDVCTRSIRGGFCTAAGGREPVLETQVAEAAGDLYSGRTRQARLQAATAQGPPL